MEDGLTSRLNVISQEFKRKHTSFPVRKCYAAASGLHLREGFLIVDGAYLGEVDKEPWTGWMGRRSMPHGPIDHYMAFDPVTRQYVDITAFQFSEGLPEILIMSEDDSRIVHDGTNIDEFHLYLPRRMMMLAEDKITLLPASPKLVPAYMLDSCLSREVVRIQQLEKEIAYSLNL